MSAPSVVSVQPACNLAGTLHVPGDKSISHRYAMLGAIAEGTTQLENFSTGADCASTLGCLRNLGVQWEKTGKSVTIHGRGRELKVPEAALNCGNSGSTLRMLSGILAGQRFTSELSGDRSLSRRPMARIIEPLQAMGARIEAQPGAFPPLYITGGNLNAIEYKMPVASAQVKSALLFAGLFANGETAVEEPARTRDHGELALRAFGASVKQQGSQVKIRGGQTLRAIEAHVPGDLSTAAFFLVAAAIFPGSQLVIPGLLMNPTRARLLDILISMGMTISVTQLEEHHGELVGTVQAQGGRLTGLRLAGNDTVALIDEIPVLAAIAPYTEDGVEIRDARELRVKESDRIAAIVANLRAMGAALEEHEDGLRIPGDQELHGAELDSFDDHRIAMAFAVTALRAKGVSEITGAEAAQISYPEFFETLSGLVQR